MSAETDQIITCAACNTKNRIRVGMPAGTFRCASCRALLLRPEGTSWLSRVIHATPELFFRFSRGATALAIFAIPLWVSYSAITNPDTSSGKSSGTYTTPRPLPPAEPAKPAFDVNKWLAENSTPPPFLEPELALPTTGDVRVFSQRERLAPFQIKSSTGTNYLIKLDDSRTGAAVLTIFVRGGSTVEVDVPLGSYIVKYASGKKWYGYKHLFGPDASYSKADTLFSFHTSGNKYIGKTITLYSVPNGNLHMGKINAAEF